MTKENIFLRIYLAFFAAITLGCSPEEKVFSLWPEGQIPNHIETNTKEVQEKTDILRIKNVQNPTIEVFLPDASIANGKSFLIFPGGGYRILAYHWEGTEVAKYLNTQGIAGFVVKYRLPSDVTQHDKHKVPLIDAQRAIRLVRSKAKTWNIEADQIGVMGFSAGGHLASTLGTHYNKEVYQSIDEIDKLSARPDFMALIYPVITMGDETHQGSKENLLGKNPSKSMIYEYSNQHHVNGSTPETFILHAMDDKVVPVANSEYFHALLSTKKKDKSSLYLYEKGGHGFSLAEASPNLREWPSKLITWLNDL